MWVLHPAQCWHPAQLNWSKMSHRTQHSANAQQTQEHQCTSTYSSVQEACLHGTTNATGERLITS